MIARKQYKGNEADVWSLGVILFVMLCGHLPFDDRNMSKMFTAILMGRYSFPADFPEGAKDLISKILKTKPAERATLECIRNHPWTNDDGRLDNVSFSGTAVEEETLSKGDPQYLEDENVINEILKIGYTQDEINDALESRNPGPVLAAYHLIRAERLRDTLTPSTQPTSTLAPCKNLEILTTNQVSVSNTKDHPNLNIDTGHAYTPRNCIHEMNSPPTSATLTPASVKSNTSKYSQAEHNYITATSTTTSPTTLGTSPESASSNNSARVSEGKPGSLISRIRTSISPTGVIASTELPDPNSSINQPRHVSIRVFVEKEQAANFFESNCKKLGVESSQQAGNPFAYVCAWPNPPYASKKDVMENAASPEEAMDMILDDLVANEREIMFVVEIGAANDERGSGGCCFRFTENGFLHGDLNFPALMLRLVEG
ncbi:hypothetical protein BC829DRAFT_15647 [Chytridium lagenaria]|nr:hypothetical protein BC829DRAFT_15647 [Chytridium lagenaria]